MSQKDAREHLSSHIKMPQISARVTTANAARTLIVEWPRVSYPLRVFHVKLAARRERLPSSPISCRQNAVEHIYPASDALYKIFRSPNAHQITRAVRGHPG